MRTRYVTLAVLAGWLVMSAPPLQAQALFCIPVEESDADFSDVAACLAATTTPFGAVNTRLPAAWQGRESTRIGLHFQFGSMNEEGDAGRRNFAVGLDIPAGRASIGLTGGVSDFTCDVPDDAGVQCKSTIMFGADLRLPLVRNALSGQGTGQAFVLGLNASAGFSTGDILEVDVFGEQFEVGGRGISIGVGVPLGIVVRSGTISITPHIEPAFFWGNTKVDAGAEGEESESGTGFALGGGISFLLDNGVSFQLGAKKVMIDEAKAMIGLGIGWQR
jgi:hypothetical protein